MDQLDENEIQALVSAALDNAADNGYDESPSDPEDVAIELADQDADIERLVWDQFDGDETILIPYIEVWQQHQSND
jgi:anti-sigma regulatory factor (Ser/Thr protein kinase)